MKLSIPRLKVFITIRKVFDEIFAYKQIYDGKRYRKTHTPRKKTNEKHVVFLK